MKKLLSITAAFCLIFGSASACVADIGTASKNVYVRDAETGDVVGALYAGESVIVTGESYGWETVEIGGKCYKVWSEYLDITPDVTLDEVDVVEKAHASKSTETDRKNGVKNKQECKIEGSIFDGKSFW